MKHTSFYGLHFTFFIVFLCFSAMEMNAQVDTQWTKKFSGCNPGFGNSIQQTSDGGYIIVGYTWISGAGGRDVYLLKTDVNGSPQFTKTFGGGNDDIGNSVQQTNDGGYIIAGNTYSFGAGNSDVYIIKTDVNGDSVWAKTYGGSLSEVGYSVQQATDGGYVVVGSTTKNFATMGADVYLIKTDANGDSLFTKNIGGIRYDEGYSVRQSSDGSYSIAGYTSSFGATIQGDVYLIKTDANGNTFFTKTFGGSADDYGHSVQQTNDGGYIIAGYTYSFGEGNSDVYLIKTDANGDTLFTKTFGGSNDDRGYSVLQTSDGGYIITGFTNSYGVGDEDIHLIKTDGNGNLQWTKIFGEIDNDWGNSVQQTTDGGYIIAGGTNSEIYLIKTTPDVVGVREANNNIAIMFSLSQNYPNPFNPTTMIQFEIPLTPFKIGGIVSLKIYNIYGQEVATLIHNRLMDEGKHEVEFDASNLESGMYFYRLEASGFVETKKLVLTK
ncbi:MAG: T9SS type A sorting domain-containing protein [Ignavibacteriales bacterium]|nr:T9SS type A sorting domain-containing protein [Ignavibacteriales bacterium]